ncbi:MAG: MBL fold metallo-hydrolase [Thiohalospira sp.]
MVRRTLATAVAVSLLGLAACSGDGAEKAYPKMEAKEVADGVWAVVSPARSFPDEENRGWNSNMAFVETGEGVLVFDTGSSETIGESLKATIREVTDAPIRWVINSSSHGDHWLGNHAFAGEDTTFLASEEVRSITETEGDTWRERVHQMTGGATGDTTLHPPKEVVAESESRTFGTVEVEMRLVGNAHSPGDLVLWLPDQEVLLAADVAFGDSAPATMDADVRHWIDTLGELEALEPEVVVPGHGRIGEGEAILADLRGYLDTLWETVEAGYERGEQDFEMRDEVDEALADHAERYPNYDERIGESISHVYLQVEEAAFGG